MTAAIFVCFGSCSCTCGNELSSYIWNAGNRCSSFSVMFCNFCLYFDFALVLYGLLCFFELFWCVYRCFALHVLNGFSLFLRCFVCVRPCRVCGVFICLSLSLLPDNFPSSLLSLVAVFEFSSFSPFGLVGVLLVPSFLVLYWKV